MVKQLNERFKNLLERVTNRTDKIYEEFEEKQRRLKKRIEEANEKVHDEYIENWKKIEMRAQKVQDEFEAKTKKIENRMDESNNRILDEFQEAIMKSLGVAEKMRDNLLRDIEKAPKHTIMGGDELSITVREVPNPETFLPEFKETGRMDFVNHYLEYKFQSRFRGNHTGRTWEYNVNEQKYKFRDSTEIIDIMLGTMPEFNKCFLTGPGFEFFRANSEDFIQHIEPLNNRTIKQFLIYMHNKLPPLRT